MCDKGVVDFYVYTWSLILTGWVVEEGAYGNIANALQGEHKGNKTMLMDGMNEKSVIVIIYSCFHTQSFISNTVCPDLQMADDAVVLWPIQATCGRSSKVSSPSN